MSLSSSTVASSPSPPRDEAVAHRVLAAPVTGRFVLTRTLQALGMYVLLKAKGFMLLPLYARLLDPAGLGVLTVAAALCGLLPPLLNLGLPTGLLVQLAHLRDRERLARAYGTVVKFAVATSCAGASLFMLLLLHPASHPSWEGLRPLAGAVGLFLVASSLRDIAVAVPQLRQETGYLCAVNLFMEYGGTALAVILLLAGFGPAGILWAAGAGLGVGVAVSLTRTFRDLGFRPGVDLPFLRSALAVGLPMLPIGMGQWALLTVDRFVLARHHGAAVVGVYGIACTLASMVFLIAATLNLVYFPAAVNLWYEGAQRFSRLQERSLRLVTALLGLFVAGAFLLSPWAVRLLAGPRYDRSAEVLPWLVLSYSALTLTHLLQVVPMVVDRRTTRVAWCYAFTVGLNVALNLALIPRWGMKGAAVASLASHLAGLLLMGRVGQRSLHGLRWRQAMALPSLLMAAMSLPALALSVPPGAPAASAVVAGAILVVCYLVAARMTGVIRKEDWGQLRAIVPGRAPELGSVVS